MMVFGLLKTWQRPPLTKSFFVIVSSTTSLSETCLTRLRTFHNCGLLYLQHFSALLPLARIEPSKTTLTPNQGTLTNGNVQDAKGRFLTLTQSPKLWGFQSRMYIATFAK